METDKKRPFLKMKDGNVRIVVWENENEKNGRKFSTFSLKAEKSYKDNDGEWQTTNNFSVDDWLKLSRLLSKAYDVVKTHEDADFDD